MNATNRNVSPLPRTKPTSAAPFPPGPRDLDGLAALDLRAAEALYRGGRVPDSLHALDGDPDCRMLSVRGLDSGTAHRSLRRLAAASAFPWEGKHFQAVSDHRGHGINRVRLAGKRRWFPFETRFDVSAIDGGPCILLDYDLRENPGPIRRIRDELREVAPGLFLGPAMWDDKKRPAALVLFFACHHVGR